MPYYHTNRAQQSSVVDSTKADDFFILQIKTLVFIYCFRKCTSKFCKQEICYKIVLGQDKFKQKMKLNILLPSALAYKQNTVIEVISTLNKLNDIILQNFIDQS